MVGKQHMSLHFSEVLRPAQIALQLKAESQLDAVRLLLNSLREDDRVTNFESLEHAVLARNAPAICENGICLCIAHGRTNALTSLVMAAGHLVSPLPVAGELCGKGMLHLVFVAGIPASLNADYLRVVGAIARICSQTEAREALLTAANPEAFLAILEDELNPL